MFHTDWWMQRVGSAAGARIGREVHVVPISREVDRAVLPFLASAGNPPVLHAHKIVLLVPKVAIARRVAAKVEQALRSVAPVERHELESDREHPTAGFQRLLHQISRLLLTELEAGNRVHINLSSGSKLVAFAAGLAGMAHLRPGHGSIYHVQPAGHTITEAEFEEHGHTRGMQDIEELELMPVLLPEPIQLRILGYLKYQPEQAAEYRDLLEFLSGIPGSDYSVASTADSRKVRDWNNAVTTRMVRKILSPLQEQGLLEILERGSKRAAHLTTRGLLYSAIAGTDQLRLRNPL